jgi:hypothetical protein
MKSGDGDPRHGTMNGYGNLRCRCNDCRAANTAHQKDYMRRHPEQREKALQRNRKYATRNYEPCWWCGVPCGPGRGIKGNGRWCSGLCEDAYVYAWYSAMLRIHGPGWFLRLPTAA